MDANVLKLLNETDNSLNFFSSNYNKLKEKYPDKFIAIKGKEVVSVGDNMKEIVKDLGKKGVDPSNVLIKFVSKLKMIL